MNEWMNKKKSVGLFIRPSAWPPPRGACLLPSLALFSLLSLACSFARSLAQGAGLLSRQIPLASILTASWLVAATIPDPGASPPVHTTRSTGRQRRELYVNLLTLPGSLVFFFFFFFLSPPRSLEGLFLRPINLCYVYFVDVVCRCRCYMFCVVNVV
jgi:hypothetical protein